MSKGLLSSADRAYFRTMMRRPINSAVHRRMNTSLLIETTCKPFYRIDPTLSGIHGA
jgi:hypothetical protein